jgi:dTDP-4-amino-4,6-dideoxygalactose transaminase
VAKRTPILKVNEGLTYVTRPSLPPYHEYLRYLKRIWRTRVLTNNGPFAAKFEADLAAYTGAAHVDVVANGTLALQLAIKTVFRPGSVVITSPFTFPATTTALLWEGMTPLFVDIDPATLNLDPELVKQRLGGRVDGILSVHVFGNPAGSEAVAALGRQFGFPVVFDAAHAFGIAARGRNLLERGDASTLSFHATKSFHTFEGGAVVSRSERISRKVRLLRNFGIVSEEEVKLPGINAKMNEMQAAMGLLNLRYIDRWIRARKRRYELYRDLLSSNEEVSFQRLELSQHNFTYMPVIFRTRRLRDRVSVILARHRIRARKYFYPLTSRPSFARRFATAPLPIAEATSQRILTLPIYPDLPLAEVRRISTIVLKVLKGEA